MIIKSRSIYLSVTNGFIVSLHSARKTKKASLTKSCSVGMGLPIASNEPPSSSIPCPVCWFEGAPLESTTLAGTGIETVCWGRRGASTSISASAAESRFTESVIGARSTGIESLGFSAAKDSLGYKSATGRPWLAKATHSVIFPFATSCLSGTGVEGNDLAVEPSCITSPLLLASFSLTLPLPLSGAAFFISGRITRPNT